MDLESVRSELRGLRDQESQLPFDSSHRERRALQAHGKTLIVNAGLWGVDKDEYARWLDGDLKGRPKMQVDFKPASSPSGYASAASAAASSAPSPLRSSITSVSPPARTLEVSTAYVAGARAAQAAGRAQASVQGGSGSRAAAVAEVHIGPINASRKRCGLPPLTAAELTHEFADLDRHPAPAKGNRRDAGNAIAARQGAPVTQSSIDGMWAGVAAKRNGTLPGRDMKNDHGLLPSSARSGSRAPQNQAEIDAMHSEIAAKLNATLPVEWRPKARR